MGVQSSLGVGVWVVYPYSTACCASGALMCFECEDTSICVCKSSPIVEEGGGSVVCHGEFVSVGDIHTGVVVWYGVVGLCRRVD